MINWILKKDPISMIVNSMCDRLAALSISYLWNFGSLLGICVVVQIVTGVFLAIHADLAFPSVEQIMGYNGWLITCFCVNAAFFFILVSVHIGRYLYHGSCSVPLTPLWFIRGIFLCIIIMFNESVLPWWQVSLWGFPIVFTAIPVIGSTLGWKYILSIHLLIFYALFFIHMWPCISGIFLAVKHEDSSAAAARENILANKDKYPISPMLKKWGYVLAYFIGSFETNGSILFHIVDGKRVPYIVYRLPKSELNLILLDTIITAMGVTGTITTSEKHYTWTISDPQDVYTVIMFFYYDSPRTPAMIETINDVLVNIYHHDALKPFSVDSPFYSTYSNGWLSGFIDSTFKISTRKDGRYYIRVSVFKGHALLSDLKSYFSQGNTSITCTIAEQEYGYTSLVTENQLFLRAIVNHCSSYPLLSDNHTVIEDLESYLDLRDVSSNINASIGDITGAIGDSPLPSSSNTSSDSHDPSQPFGN